MTISRNEVAATVLAGKPTAPQPFFQAFAPVNIALCKYWGKRQHELNTPLNDSLSITLPETGSTTRISRQPTAADRDRVVFNGQSLQPGDPMHDRILAHVELFRSYAPGYFLIETDNDVATGAGLASSASGFAALTRALAGVAGIALSERELSILSRLGSGSACRSISNGFGRWHRGERVDGMDSFATFYSWRWPQLRVGVLTVAKERKPVGSREGMARTVQHSTLYQVG